jgi:hypothetical protein
MWKMECSIQLGCRLVEWNIPSEEEDFIQHALWKIYKIL